MAMKWIAVSSVSLACACGDAPPATSDTPEAGGPPVVRELPTADNRLDLEALREGEPVTVARAPNIELYGHGFSRDGATLRFVTSVDDGTAYSMVLSDMDTGRVDTAFGVPDADPVRSNRPGVDVYRFMQDARVFATDTSQSDDGRTLAFVVRDREDRDGAVAPRFDALVFRSEAGLERVGGDFDVPPRLHVSPEGRAVLLCGAWPAGDRWASTGCDRLSPDGVGDGHLHTGESSHGVQFVADTTVLRTPGGVYIAPADAPELERVADLGALLSTDLSATLSLADGILTRADRLTGATSVVGVGSDSLIATANDELSWAAVFDGRGLELVRLADGQRLHFAHGAYPGGGEVPRFLDAERFLYDRPLAPEAESEGAAHPQLRDLRLWQPGRDRSIDDSAISEFGLPLMRAGWVIYEGFDRTAGGDHGGRRELRAYNIHSEQRRALGQPGTEGPVAFGSAATIALILAGPDSPADNRFVTVELDSGAPQTLATGAYGLLTSPNGQGAALVRSDGDGNELVFIAASNTAQPRVLGRNVGAYAVSDRDVAWVEGDGQSGSRLRVLRWDVARFR